MNSTIQWITFAAALLFLIQVVYLTAKNKLHDKYAFIWIIFAIAGLFLSLSLPFLNDVSTKIGISYMPSLVFMFAFLVILIVLTYQTVLLSRHEKLIKQLVQEIGFLDNQLQESKRGSGK
ncbi:DUF2304 domain-containing protein [Filibacter tadaridae]|uniref:DUF2304 domain-containing protein n=1 Tax=Filibacter tadaridae TaxID=2483811 RepID=A0A3P5WZX4_9BACL|nr:DUF2304 domain-containing protein [Filibacter tadaridae]VDC23906.1 hypothetical protein FILTAD_00920 [Filibacter tadaridae]